MAKAVGWAEFYEARQFIEIFTISWWASWDSDHPTSNWSSFSFDFPSGLDIPVVFVEGTNQAIGELGAPLKCRLG